MPDYLLLHLKKFTLREDWTSMKLDVAVEIPDELDLSSLKGAGLQPNEELLPELTGKAPELPPYDQEVYSKLVSVFASHLKFKMCANTNASFSTDRHGFSAKCLPKSFIFYWECRFGVSYSMGHGAYY